MTEKSKLQTTLDKLNKDYGKGTIIMGNEKPEVIDVISTGSLGLNSVLGVGGLPCGRIVEFIGPFSSGKTSLALHTIAEAQLLGKKAAFIDMEHAISLEYAKALGVNTEELLLCQPDYGEQALDIVKQLCETGEVAIIVIDSVAALVPKSEVDGNVGDSSIGKQARMMSQALRMITPIAEKNNVLVIFLNQIRMKVGVLFGSPETGCGGESLPFYASVRLDIRKSVLSENGEPYGNKTKVKVLKNKVAPPLKICEFDIIYGQGIDKDGEALELAIDFDIINKSGSWFSYGDAKIGQGIDKVKAFLQDNPELKEEIKQKVVDKIQQK